MCYIERERERERYRSKLSVGREKSAKLCKEMQKNVTTKGSIGRRLKSWNS